MLTRRGLTTALMACAGAIGLSIPTNASTSRSLPKRFLPEEKDHQKNQQLWIIQTRSFDRMYYSEDAIYSTKETACKFAIKRAKSLTKVWDVPVIIMIQDSKEQTPMEVGVLCE